jgi:hypothetical protein
MIEGFKNREVVCEPLQYTAALLSGELQREYAETGAITLPYVEPIERLRDDYLSRDWDAKDFHNGDADEELENYLNWLDLQDEDDEGGCV